MLPSPPCLPAVFAFVACALLACLPALAAGTGNPAAAPSTTARLDIRPAPPGRLPWVVFDERSGLPQHTIVDLLADQRGFVWAATQDGASRYNGRSWDTIPLPAVMRSNYARIMRTAGDGGLWIGSFDGGLAHLRDGEWRTWGLADGLPSNRIRGLLETSDDSGVVLWIATDQGVARLRAGRITAYGLDAGLPSLDTEALIEQTTADGNRHLLVGTAEGLARFDGRGFVIVPIPQSLLGHRIDDMVESTGLSGGPALWIASYGAGMAVLEAGRWTVLDTSSGLPSNVEVFTKSEAADGSPALWIGSEGGLLRFEHGRFTLYDERSGLPSRMIWKVLETRLPGGLKTLWLGTWGSGIVRLSPNGWTAHDTSTGLPPGAVTSMLQSRDDAGREVIWAGTADGELARLSGDRFETVPLPPALHHAIVFSLLETRRPDGGRILWVASFGGGIGRLEDGRWTVMDLDSLPNRRIYHLHETRDPADGSSILWAASEGGLGRYHHGLWTYTRKGQDLPSEIVTQVLETEGRDGRRSLWAATSRGIARLQDGRWTVMGKASGLASENISSLQLATDAQDRRWLWAGTFSGGAARLLLDDPKARWESFTTRSSPALPSDTVQSVAVDKAGRIYLCTTRGVARLTPRQPTPGRTESFEAELFTTEDGLPSSDCQQGARLVDEHGRVWMGTARGLGMLDPRQELPDQQPKPLLIDRASLADGSLVLRGGERLSHRQRNLRFSAALLAHAAESRIRYRYQLEGFDPAPTDWIEARSKEYTNLGAGDYRFLLWGRDARGNVSGPVALPFTVAPAPWLTAWAWAVYALLAMLIVYAAVQWRVRFLAQRTRELETEVAARTSDLVAARDELQRLATEDALTGVANRRKFGDVLVREWRRAQREGQVLGLALLDVDFFKRYNDRHGHAGGDHCLRAVAQAVAGACTRPTDLVARYGGEEFALVLPATGGEALRSLLRSVLAAVDDLRIEHGDSNCAPNVTISLGAISLVPGSGDESHAALQRADELLYRAKAEGRHRAMCLDESGAVIAIIPAADDAAAGTGTNAGDTATV